MENEINLIKLFKKKNKEINESVLVVGSGRWAKEIISEIHKNFPNIKKIFILTRHKKQFQSWASSELLKKVIFFISTPISIACNDKIINLHKKIKKDLIKKVILKTSPKK